MWGNKLQQAVRNQPTYNDQGQMLGVGNTTFARPADNTDLAFSHLAALQSHFQPVMRAQTNHMDEAYNAMPRAVPRQTAPPTAQMIQQDGANRSLQSALFSIFGGVKR